MRKTIWVTAAMICILAVTGCNTAPAPGSTGYSKPAPTALTDKGLALIGIVDKLAECEEYTALHTSSPELAGIIKGIAEQDYTGPQGVFIIENLNSMLFERILLEAKLPADIEEIVKSRFVSALPSQINGMNGAETLAATSILNYEDSFIFEDLKSPATYLYTYGNGYSFMVSYTPNDENIVNVGVMVVVNDPLSKCSTIEDVTGFFKDALYIEGVSVSVATESKS